MALTKGGRMKKRTSIGIGALVFILLSGLATAQTIIENPAKPDNRRAGRVVTLKEEMRIEDTSGNFFLKYVFGLAIGAYGEIVINDMGEQALQFDGQGRFIRNLMKKGQGPGELDNLSDIWIGDDRLVLCGNPSKVIVINKDGKQISEFAIRGASSRSIRLINADDTNIFLWRTDFPDFKNGSGWKTIPAEIIKIDGRSGDAISLASFSSLGYIALSSGGRGASIYQSFSAVPAGNGKIAVSCTPDYLIKLIGKKNGDIILAFRREYDRIRRFTRKEIEMRGGAPEYWNDILALHIVDGKIWVQTSTIDPKKGSLFDVFDQSGRYIDRFYLKWSNKDVDPKRSYKIFAFAGGFVYFDDKSDDELIVIRKCRLVGL
jgi:hypothetical protein